MQSKKKRKEMIQDRAYLAIDLGLRWALNAKAQCTGFTAGVHSELCRFVDYASFQARPIGFDFRCFVFAYVHFKRRAGDFHVSKSDHNYVASVSLKYNKVC